MKSGWLCIFLFFLDSSGRINYKSTSLIAPRQKIAFRNSKPISITNDQWFDRGRLHAPFYFNLINLTEAVIDRPSLDCRHDATEFISHENNSIQVVPFYFISRI